MKPSDPTRLSPGLSTARACSSHSQCRISSGGVSFGPTGSCLGHRIVITGGTDTKSWSFITFSQRTYLSLLPNEYGTQSFLSHLKNPSVRRAFLFKITQVTSQSLYQLLVPSKVTGELLGQQTGI